MNPAPTVLRRVVGEGFIPSLITSRLQQIGEVSEDASFDGNQGARRSLVGGGVAVLFYLIVS
jgi:hypothetical protein